MRDDDDESDDDTGPDAKRTDGGKAPAGKPANSGPSLSMLISIGSFLLSFAAFYYSSIYYNYNIFVSQEGNGAYVSKKISNIEVTTQDYAHFSFINSGTRPVLVDEVDLVVFQPGNTQYSNIDLGEYTEGLKGNAFDGVHCQGDMNVNRFDFVSFEVKPGDIEIKPANLEHHGTQAVRHGSDQIAHGVADIAVTPENRAQPTQQFLYCFTIKLRLTDGERFISNRAAWFAAFKRASPKSDELAEASFKWLGGLDTRIIDRRGSALF